MDNCRWAWSLALAGILGVAPRPAGAVDATVTYLYLHDKGTGTVHGFSIAGSDLTELPGFPVTEPGTSSPTDAQCQTIAYSPSRHLLFTTCSGGVNSYLVAADGSLSSVAGSPFGPGTGKFQGIGVVETKKGLGVYANSRDDDAIFGFTAAADGVLTPVPDSPFAMATSSAYGICAFGTAVFVPGYGDDTFESYRAGKDFRLSRSKTAGTGAANYFAFPDPKRKFLFSSSYDQASDQVYSFKVSKASGRMKPVKGSPFPMGDGADMGADLLVGPGGLAVGLSYFGSTAQAMTYDGKGRFLPLGGAQDLGLQGRKVGVFLPGANVLCIACDGTKDLRSFTIDPATGALSLADTVDLGNFSHKFNGVILAKR